MSLEMSPRQPSNNSRKISRCSIKHWQIISAGTHIITVTAYLHCYVQGANCVHTKNVISKQKAVASIYGEEFITGDVTEEKISEFSMIIYN